MIPRITTKPLSWAEVLSGEYEYVDLKEYMRRDEKGMLLHWKEATGHKILGNRVTYFRGTPHPNFWSLPTADTEFLLSVFGTRVAPQIQKIAPEMVNICLTARNKVLYRRVLKRARDRGLPYPRHHIDDIRSYRKAGVEANFQHVIDNSDMTPMEVAKKIEEILGFEPSRF